MEIIKHGSNFKEKEEKYGRITCHNCDCVFDWDDSDITTKRTYYLDTPKIEEIVMCPECHTMYKVGEYIDSIRNNNLSSEVIDISALTKIKISETNDIKEDNNYCRHLKNLNELYNSLSNNFNFKKVIEEDVGLTTFVEEDGIETYSIVSLGKNDDSVEIEAGNLVITIPQESIIDILERKDFWKKSLDNTSYHYEIRIKGNKRRITVSF